jgi:Tripartite tricarboxylate transporter TctB family
MRAANRSIGVICGGLGILCLLEAHRLWAGWPGPGTMPLVIGLIFILQAALYLGSPWSQLIPISWERRDTIATMATLAALFAAYVMAIPWAGFTVSTWVFTTLVARSISSEPSWVKTAIFMAALSVASHYVFNQLLGASLPVNSYGF